MPLTRIKFQSQLGSVLVLALIMTALMAIIIASVYRMQSASTKKNDIVSREYLADAAISFCYTEVSMQLANVNGDSYDLLARPMNSAVIPAILKQCSLSKLADPSQVAATQTNNCSVAVETSYYELTALAQFSDGIKYETRSIVTDNPCI